MVTSLKNELKKIIQIIKELDRRVIIVFLTVAILQTVSWYYGSRRFFRANLQQYFTGNELLQLYEYLFWFISDFIILFLVPLFIIKFLLKDKIKEYGVTFGDKKAGFILTGVFVLFMIPFLWFFSASPEFAAKYPHLQSAKLDWTIFIIYEIGMFIYLFAWEYIWRGFMLFGLEKKFGYYAVLIQMIPFVILHNGKPEIETFSSILGGIALGILALRTRSFIYGVFVHFAVMLFIDLFSTLRTRADAVFEVVSDLF